MIEKIEISKSEYEELISDRKLLDALLAAGVDNWDGYEMAIDIMEEE